MICNAKHTEYNPSEEEFVCPKCGSIDFFIDYIPEDANEECEKLHVDDFIYCDKCQYETTGKKFAEYVIKQKNLVKCPHCKGKGMVPRDQQDVFK